MPARGRPCATAQATVPKTESGWGAWGDSMTRRATSPTFSGRGVTIWQPVAERSNVSADHPAPAWDTTTRYFAVMRGKRRGFWMKSATPLRLAAFAPLHQERDGPRGRARRPGRRGLPVRPERLDEEGREEGDHRQGDGPTHHEPSDHREAAGGRFGQHDLGLDDAAS